jgi:hypothetical protein
MATFDFPYHQVRTEYPDSTTRVQMGKGWVYPIKPSAPDQRLFVLSFPGMQYFLDGAGAIDATILPQRNMAAMEAFYQAVLCWDIFNYVHPVYGPMNVRFNRPLQVPKGVIDGNGLLESFDVTFIEVPA